MKPHLTPALALVAFSMVARAPAFTLDFASLSTGAPVPGSPGQLLLNVPGYGNIQLQSAPGSSLEIAPFGSASGVNFEDGETLKINFLAGPLVASPVFDEAELISGESFSVLETAPGAYEVSFTGSGGGITGAHFIPESSTLLAGSMGLLLLFHRRREPATTA
ncbi:MAG: hypothetical protein J0M04_22610 [Verrucomicrobia bacterium]|nr:hypothetical protein [Verrucomicrobiota bacterium]